MTRFKPALARLLEQRQILLSASLLVLVAGFAQGPTSESGHYLILAHFGLFLLWQPIVRPRYRLGATDLILLVTLLTGFLLAMSSALLAVWVVVLASVVAGRSFIAPTRLSRLPYLLAVGLLVLFLVVVLVPAALDLDSDEIALFSGVTRYLLPVLAVSIAFLPVEADFDPQTLGGVDLLSAMVLALVIAVTLLGALALMQVRGLPYFQSLALALTGMAGGLLLLAWAWHPRLGYAGLGVQLTRRMLSSGLSFESWLHGVAADALAQGEPDQFLREALQDMTRFPSIVGGAWQYQPSGAAGRFGIGGVRRERFAHAGLSVELEFSRPPGEGLLWHYNLMLTVLAEFYREKCQTRLLQLRSFEEAVHETGARLTHDVKNLLQSINALCFAAGSPDADGVALQQLFRRQLPRIAARLEATLEKLRQPEEAVLSEVGIADWWREACARHDGQRIRFMADLGDARKRIPAELYDTCLDNLVQNAIGKRRLEPGIDIAVALDAQGRLRVSDSGSALDPELARCVLRQPLRSAQGLGMGLYQAAQLAVRAGYRIELARNETGAVLFELAPTAAASPGGDSLGSAAD